MLVSALDMNLKKSVFFLLFLSFLIFISASVIADNSAIFKLDRPQLLDQNTSHSETIFSSEALQIANISYFAQFIEVNALSQRMSELHKSQEGGNVWARVYTGYLDSFNNPYLDYSKYDYTGGQIGADQLIYATDQENILVGLFAGYSHGKVLFNDNGDQQGKTTTYTGGVYATYKHDSGFYTDATLKYQRIQNQLALFDEFDGKGSSNGYSASIEVGKRFTAKNENTLAQVYWFFEPQLQLTYTHQGKATLESGDATTVFSQYNSLIGRASVLTGYSIISTELDIIDLYLKVGYVREFDGATSYTYNELEPEEYHFKGGYFDSAFGVNYEMSKTYSFYMDINYMQGKLLTNRQLNVGYRYYF